jgi:hypothetical protein
MKRQTAVEWLISQQKHNQLFDIEIIEQAKEMEKYQMCNHFREGYMFANMPMLSVNKQGEIITSTMKYAELYYDKLYK